MSNRPYELFLKGPEQITTVLITEGQFQGIEFSYHDVKINSSDDGEMYASFQISTSNEFENESKFAEFEAETKNIFLNILEDAVAEMQEKETEKTKNNDANENNPTQSSGE